ncbi:MAG: tetratricopeptide repeat protein [Hahellaceae bacterium]|nr:tetratricopeptide repeat protein [Hahellaceae bacterium]
MSMMSHFKSFSGFLALLIWLSGCATQQTEQPIEAQVAEGQAATVVAPAIDPAVQALFDQGVDAMKQNRLADARVSFEQIHNQQPDLSGPLLNLGIIAFKEKDRSRATEYFNKAVETNPSNTEALNFLGVMAREDGKFAESEGFYRKALEVDPDFASAHLNLGMLLELYLGRLEEALEQYEIYQGLQKEPDPKVKNWIADLKNRVK